MSQTPAERADAYALIIQYRDYLADLANKYEAELAEYKRTAPTYDHDAHLAGMRATVAHGDAMIARWRDERLALEGD